MSRMTILTEAELRRIVSLDLDAVACVEAAFEALATKAVAMPPILRLDIPEHRGRVMNGFALVTLAKDGGITERFLNQDGSDMCG